MFENLKQKLESEKVKTLSLLSNSDITLNPPSHHQFDESSASNVKRKNSNVSIDVPESEVKRSNSNGNAHESILKWMMNKSSASAQDITNLSQRLSNPSLLLRPTSRSSVTLNESSVSYTTTAEKSDSENEKLKCENNRLRDEIKKLTRKLEAASTSSEKPVDQIDERMLKMVEELIVKESNEGSSQPKEVTGGVKSSSGNWSSLLLPPANAVSNDQHKQEIDKLQKRINELEESLREKNKTIRLQQQRINDIRKSFQRGPTALDSKLFDLPGNGNDNESTTIDGSSTNNSLTTSKSENGFNGQPSNQTDHPNQLKHHHQRQLSDSQSSLNCPMNDISWQYLRSVVFKFVLTSDYEAQKHLVKAISMILQFSDAEERQIRDSLEQKVSWFKNLPLLGNGTKYKHYNNSNHH